jgi:hypothetical protein
MGRKLRANLFRIVAVKLSWHMGVTVKEERSGVSVGTTVVKY